MSLRKVLVLGSGFMSSCLVEMLTRDGTMAVTVASNIEKQARQLAQAYQNTTATKVDVQSESSLSGLIPGHDVVVSYVPNQLHPLVAKQCLAHRVNMVTASYVSPALQELDGAARDAGVTFLNEVGLDPGIDHMLAMQCFDEVREKKGRVTSFQSWCGGLPAPECADSPLKYKFSWNPRNVFLGPLSTARYLQNGQLVEVPAGGSVMDAASPVDLYPDMPPLEGYPNRDSLKYISIYGIPEAQTVLRGTLRYKGFCHVLGGLQKLGLLNETRHQRLEAEAAPLRWRDLMAVLISQGDVRAPDLREAVLEALAGDEIRMKAVEELGLMSDEPVELCGSPLGALCSHLEHRLAYRAGERDAIYLHHIIGIEWPDQSKETRHINLTHYGTPNGFSAMAQCVAKPTAIAIQMLLSGELTDRGIVTPTTRSIYLPLLERLKVEGIEATFRTDAR